MNIYKRLYEKIKITFTADEKDKALNYVKENGYKSIYRGPKFVGKGKIDKSKFEIIAERRLDGVEMEREKR